MEFFYVTIACIATAIIFFFFVLAAFLANPIVSRALDNLYQSLQIK